MFDRQSMAVYNRMRAEMRSGYYEVGSVHGWEIGGRRSSEEFATIDTA